MKKLLEIYDEAEKCADKHHSSSKVRCLKNMLKREINNDKDLLLEYKIISSKFSGYEEIGFAVATFSNAGKYKTIYMVLEHIEKEMDQQN